VLRTSIIYAYGLVLLRWLGSRTVGQLSTVEFLLVIALGSAVGDPMFYPDVPLLHGMAVMTVIVVANRLLDLLIARFKAAERLLDGKPLQVVEHGVLTPRFLNATDFGHSEIFQQLRHRGIRQLGQVEGAFIEPDGVLTVFEAPEARPGLPIVPPWEIAPLHVFGSGERPDEGRTLACINCGFAMPAHGEPAATACPECNERRWTAASLASAGGSGAGQRRGAKTKQGA
jgi:hypothetical protein